MLVRGGYANHAHEHGLSANQIKVFYTPMHEHDTYYARHENDTPRTTHHARESSNFVTKLSWKSFRRDDLLSLSLHSFFRQRVQHTGTNIVKWRTRTRLSHQPLSTISMK